MISIFESRTVTLDISSLAVRLLATSGNRVERWASAPLEAGLIENGLITDPPALGASVKSLMRSSGINATRVISSISGQNSVFRVVTLPESGERSSRQKAVEDSIKELMPLDDDQLYISWQIAFNGGSTPRALVAGTACNTMDAHVQALKAAGISPHVVTLKGMALMNLVDYRHALIVNVEPDSLDIAVKVDGMPAIVRTLTQHPDLDLEDRIDYLVRVLWQIRNFLESHLKTIDFEQGIPLFLTGSLMEAPEMTELVQKRVEHSVLPVIVPLDFSHNLPVCQFAVNLGLAIPGPVIEHAVKETNGAGKGEV